MPRIDLTVPYQQKDEAKRLGARWDAAQKTWYVPESLDPAPFARWMPVAEEETKTWITIPTSHNNRIVWFDDQLPAHLFDPRRIVSLSEVSDLFWSQDRLFLLNPDPFERAALHEAGAKTDDAGTYVQRDAEIDFSVLNGFLPFAAKSIIVPRLGDLIPPSSFGSNLCNLLTQACWDGLRKGAFSATGSRCEICGSNDRLECHEFWEYHEPLPAYLEKGACGVQRLVRLMPLCDACHETYHLGLANVRGRSAIAGERIRAFNRWTQDEYEEYCDFINERGRRRMECYWVLDLSILDPVELDIHEKWRRQDSGWLSCNTKTGLSETMIHGVAWAHSGSRYPAVSADIAYYE